MTTGFRRVFLAFTERLDGNFPFGVCNVLADFARRAVGETGDLVIFREAIRGSRCWAITITGGTFAMLLSRSCRESGTRIPRARLLRVSGWQAWTRPNGQSGTRRCAPSAPHSAPGSSVSSKVERNDRKP